MSIFDLMILYDCWRTHRPQPLGATLSGAAAADGEDVEAGVVFQNGNGFKMV